MKNIIEKIKNKNIKSAFSLLRKANKNFVILNLFQNLKIFSEPASLCGENALRSEQSPAMLTQSQVCSSHTLLRKSAFSLAEVMVLLTIVAIMLALSAPLISKPSNTDPQHLLKKGVDNEVIVANGNYQVLNVGMNSSDNLKLVVRGANEYNADKSLKKRAQAGLFSGVLRIPGSDERCIKIDENGFAMIKGDETDENTLFRVKSTGDININVAQIDKSRTYRVGKDDTSPTTFVETNLPADGYLYVAPTGVSTTLNNELVQIGYGYSTLSNVANAFSIQYDSAYTTPAVDSTEYEAIETYSGTILRNSILPNMVYKNIDGEYRVIPIRMYPMLIPVQKGLKARCYGWSHGDQWKCGFWPLKENINVNTQKSGSQVVFYNDSSSCYLREGDNCHKIKTN